MSDIITLTGSKHRSGPAIKPALRLVRDSEQADAELLAPISDAIFQIGANAAKLAAMLNDRDEARRQIDAEIDVRLGYVEEVA